MLNCAKNYSLAAMKLPAREGVQMASTRGSTSQFWGQPGGGFKFWGRPKGVYYRIRYGVPMYVASLLRYASIGSMPHTMVTLLFTKLD